MGTLDSFLSFQLEAAFSSAFVLFIVDKIAPGFVIDASYLPAVHNIFATMVEKGSSAASIRRSEFERLEQMMLLFLRQVATTDDETEPSQHENDDCTQSTSLERDTRAEQLSMDLSACWHPLEQYSDFNLSATDILNLVDGLQEKDIFLDC